MDGWSGLMTGKPPQGYVWPVPLAPHQLSHSYQALGPWFWPPAPATNSVAGLAPAPLLAPPPPIAPQPSALPKQTTVTEADVGKVAYEMTYAANPTAGLGGPPVVQTTRETTITPADVGKWAFEITDPTPFPGAPNPVAFPFTNMPTALSASKSDARWYEGNRRHTSTKIFKDKSTQKYLVFDKHTQTEPKSQWQKPQF